MGVNMGDMDGEVGVGDGLNETKKTALVSAPDTRWRWIDEGVSVLDDHLGTRYIVSSNLDSATRETFSLQAV